MRGEILLLLIGATVVFAGWRVLHRQSGHTLVETW